ncbi:hypothetical protein [uncultured Nostoc sp.]|uniref:hypothetical protein n=1 Tax=uncultured Nostoc sp. TaxID=340711 RepID=UPI0035CA60BA
MSLSITDVFDANFYSAANPDLAIAGLTTDTQLLSHFQTFGLNEGRPFSPLINFNFYRASNSDLANLNNSQLLDHLENNGVAEGRSFSPLVDLNYYRINNSDIASLNNEQLFNHLKNNGIAEGRYFSPIFNLGLSNDNLGLYRDLNPDLASLNNSQLLNHFEIYGLNEGRQFSPYIDFNYYRANNSDLANFSNSQLLEHFEIFGLNEGRKSSPFFDVGYYKANNPDLASLNGIQLLEHFNYYGQYEGRPGSSDYAGNTLSTARQLSVNSNFTYVFDSVGSSDSNDYYRLDLDKASTVSIINFSYSRSVIEQILDSQGQVINSTTSYEFDRPIITKSSSTNIPIPDGLGLSNSDVNQLLKSADTFQTSLAPGTYYIRIEPQADNTDYYFYISAT